MLGHLQCGHPELSGRGSRLAARATSPMYATGPSAGGACNYGATSVLYYAAVNVNVAPGDGQGQWQGGRICGQCVEVTALTSQGPESVVVRIMDKCPDGDCGTTSGARRPRPSCWTASGATTEAGASSRARATRKCPTDRPACSSATAATPGGRACKFAIRLGAVASIAWQDPAGPSHGAFPYAADPENTFEVPTEVLQSSATSIAITVQYADGTRRPRNSAPINSRMRARPIRSIEFKAQSDPDSDPARPASTDGNC